MLLKIATKELLPDRTVVYQSDGGTVYYWKYTSPERLYVKWEGNEVDAVLPSESISNVRTHGDALFFVSKQKFYQAAFIPKTGIKVVYLRDDEQLSDIFCERTRDGKNYVYRIGEKDSNGICDDMSSNFERKRCGEIGCVQRGKIIYSSQKPNKFPTVRRVNGNVVIVEGNNLQICSRNSYEYIYFTCDNKTIHAFHSQTFEFLQPVEIENVNYIDDIIGVRNGVFILKAKERTDCDFSIITAAIPNEFFKYVLTAYAMKDSHQENGNTKVAEAVEKRKIEKSLDACPAGNDFDDLLEQCCCSICSESFDSIKFIPRNLVCGHTFCEICINNEKLRTVDEVKCPNCSTITYLLDGNDLPKNFSIISMAEQLIKSRVDPKIACKACTNKFSSSSICMCNKEDCDMYNQLLCLSCTLDGGHGGHAVKYDVKIEKIRGKLRENVTSLCSKIEEKKTSVLEKTKQLSEMFTVLEKNLSELNIPPPIIEQLKAVASELDAEEYTEIVENLAKTIIDECEEISEDFDHAITSATRLIHQ